MAAFLVYVGNAGSGSISVFTLAATGELAPIETVMVPGAGDISAFSLPLAVSPDRCFLYAALRSPPFPIVTFRIDPQSGRLTHVATAPLPYSAPFIATDRTGRFLLSASYHDGAVAVNAIDSAGAIIAPARQLIAAGPKMHCVVIDGANRRLYAACLGSDAIFRYIFHAATGAIDLTTASKIQASPHSGPRHLAFHPSRRFFYAIGELDATITAYAVESDTGALREIGRVGLLPPDFNGTPSAADLHVTPDGRFLYGSERTTSTIAGFAIDHISGQLSPLGTVPVEPVPRAFAIDPQSRLLLVAGLECNRLGVYAIGAAGALSRLADHPAGLAPSWIEIIDFARSGPES